MSENKVVIIEKNGNYDTRNVKNLDSDNIYKKCGFRNEKNFGYLHTWNIKHNKKKYNIAIYGKVKGFANTENKYDLPPPLDNNLYFGKLILINLNKEDASDGFNRENIIDFTTDEWSKIYEKLFGGFEDLGGIENDLKDAEEDKDDLEDIPKKMLTKQGYLKDGFVVDSDEDNKKFKVNSSKENVILDENDEIESNEDQSDDLVEAEESEVSESEESELSEEEYDDSEDEDSEDGEDGEDSEDGKDEK